MRENCSEKYKLITETLISRGISITTMESCTSGLIASLITDTEGASAILRGAFITYSNEAKIRCGVPSDVIERYGVYSEETARAMARAAADAYNADISVGITGSFANADPENADSEPGVVYLAICVKGGLSAAQVAGAHSIISEGSDLSSTNAAENQVPGKRSIISEGCVMRETPAADNTGVVLKSYTIEGIHGSCRYEDKLIAAEYVADELLSILAEI